jgi:thiamine-phosphate diphosphorylase
MWKDFAGFSRVIGIDGDSYNTPSMAERSVRGLYVIIDPDACGSRPVVDVAREALKGGAALLQWRDKQREKGDQLDDARDIAALCAEHNALFIVNDHVDLALVVRADGVHLGQHDLPVEAVRPLVPNGFIVGVSTNSAEEASRAQANGASYIAIGAVFPTKSKERERTRAASVERVREVKAAVGVPVVAIGGINASNARQVVEAGADAVAVISAVCGAADPCAAAAELVTLIAAR